MIRTTLLVPAALLAALPTFSQAAPPAPYHYTTVRWVVNTRDNLDVDDRYVTLIGRVTRRIGDEEYWFTDGTGSVRLDSEDFDLPVGAKLVIGGRIDQAYLGFGHLEVDVRHWHYAPVARRIAKHSAPAPTAPSRSVSASPAPAAAPSAGAAPGTSAAGNLAPPAEPITNSATVSAPPGK